MLVLGNRSGLANFDCISHLYGIAGIMDEVLFALLLILFVLWVFYIARDDYRDSVLHGALYHYALHQVRGSGFGVRG